MVYLRIIIDKLFFKLGVILMDEIADSETAFEFFIKNNINNINAVYSHVYYQFIYLFLIIGIINFDMHQDNVLVYPKYAKYNNINTQMIDCGEIDDLKDINKNKYLTKDEKMFINNIRNSLIIELNSIIEKFKIDNRIEEKNKINFIMKTMNIINIICWAVNRKNPDYVLENKISTIHQMDEWFKPSILVKEYIEKVSTIENQDKLNYQYKNIIKGSEMGNLIENLLKNEYFIISNTTDNDNTIFKKTFEILIQNYSINKCGSYHDYDNYDNYGPSCIINGGKKNKKFKKRYKTLHSIKSNIKIKRKSKKFKKKPRKPCFLC